MSQENGAKKNVFLVFGKSGWIGGLVGELLKQQGETFEYATARLEDRAAILADIERVKPTHIISAAGVTGRPNVDWCETHKVDRIGRLRNNPGVCVGPAVIEVARTCELTSIVTIYQVETIRANVIGCLNLADITFQKGIHMTYFGTGCIFHYDENFPEGSGKGFKESDTPNFTGSYYSKTKAMLENLLREYPNVLTLRVRMPIVGDLCYPRNFVTKIIKYAKVVNIPNSMTVLPELLPMSIEMAKRGLTGIMNYTNPGAISHNEILQMYKDHVDPEFTWSNFTLEEQAKVIVAPRSNNLMDTERIKGEFPEILPIKDSIFKYVIQPAIGNQEVVAAVRAMRQ